MHHLKYTLYLILIFVSTCQSLYAQLSEKYKGYGEHYFKSMRYGLYKPANYDATKSYPLIVYLHGSTDTVSRDLRWYQEPVQKENPCFILTPKCEEPNQGWGNTWHDKHTTYTARVLALTDSLLQQYNININRLYLYGISMGGFGVFSILQKEPGKFAAAYAVCGGSDIKAAGKMLTSPLWIFHGGADDVVPVNLSRDTYKEIIRLGGSVVRYTEYPGVKHNSWENVDGEKTLVRWLFLQRKGTKHAAPDPLTGMKVQLQNNAVTLTWRQPVKNGNVDKEVWYYKIFRDSNLIGEIDGDAVSFVDVKSEPGNHAYSMSAVNYFFMVSESVKVSGTK